MKNLIWISTMALGCMALLPACNGASIEGAWVEPVPGMENMQQGFVLEPDGTASSINMATLQYESWKKEGDVLILAGKSIGNHQTIAFSDTLVIQDLSDKTLLLEKNGTVYSYSRSDEAQTSQTALPAQQKETISVKGELIIAHEVRSFVADGDTVCYWVIDKTGELYKQYDELTKGQKNGVPVHAELEVRDMGKSQEGFAAEYDGVYEVVKIDKLSAK